MGNRVGLQPNENVLAGCEAAMAAAAAAASICHDPPLKLGIVSADSGRFVGGIRLPLLSCGSCTATAVPADPDRREMVSPSAAAGLSDREWNTVEKGGSVEFPPAYPLTSSASLGLENT